MLVAEKPPLDEDLLVHFGVKGMRWGQRKPDDGTGMSPSTKKKVVVGVGIAVGVAAGAYLLSKRGTVPAVKSFESKSTKLGFRAAGSILKRVGKVSVNAIGKASKVTAKASIKTGQILGKQSVRIVRKVSVNSAAKTVAALTKAGQSVARGYGNFQAKRALRNAPQVIEAGSKFSQLFLARFGAMRKP